MGVSALHHLNIRTTDVDATQKFYEDIVGLHVGPRPAFPGPGIWLYAGDHPWVHVSMAEKSSGDDNLKADGFGHIAFAVDDLKTLMDKLADNNIEHDLHAGPGRQLAQLFFHDPNGVHLEFTCPLADAEAQGVEVPDRRR